MPWRRGQERLVRTTVVCVRVPPARRLEARRERASGGHGARELDFGHGHAFASAALLRLWELAGRSSARTGAFSASALSARSSLLDQFSPLTGTVQASWQQGCRRVRGLEGAHRVCFVILRHEETTAGGSRGFSLVKSCQLCGEIAATSSRGLQDVVLDDAELSLSLSFCLC